MAEARFVAADLGASGGRVLCADFDGERFDVRELHRFPNGPVRVLGRLYWDALGLWGHIQEGLRRAGEASKPLAGVSVDAWGVDFGLLDGHGGLLANPYHYRDAQTEGMIVRVLGRVPKADLYERTGIQFMQINTLYQLEGLLARSDVKLQAATTLLMMPDLFHAWLTGRYVSEYTAASTSGLLDARRRDWDRELLARLGLPVAIFPELVMPGTVIGPLRDDVAADLGQVAKAPVIATGGHDTASAVAAIPDLSPRSAFISSGTWSLMGVEIMEPVLSEAALALNLTNEGGVGGTIRLLKNVAGLWLLQACRAHWARAGQTYGWEELLAQARAAPPFRSFVNPGADTFLNPPDMPEAIRAACRRSGQREPEGVGEVVRCCLESLALKYRSVLDGLETLLGHELDTIFIVGGGAQNATLNQFTADACRRTVVAGPVEATALGNLMMQAVATGYLADVAAGRRAVAASAPRTVYHPAQTARWEDAYSRFQAMLKEEGREDLG